jgi:hypothetical protein
MDNKRILTFSEFTNAYSKGDQFSAPGNDEKSVEKMQDVSNELTDSPNIPDSKGDMDSISSKPATKFIKTDYEKSPSIPNGPVKLKDVDKEDKSDDNSKEEGEKESSNKKVKSIKKTKEDSKKSKEDEREESGKY